MSASVPTLRGRLRGKLEILYYHRRNRWEHLQMATPQGQLEFLCIWRERDARLRTQTK